MKNLMDMIDSSKHMSVVVMLKSAEFLVDLMCFPGLPFSFKVVITSHMSAAGESDSADYDSCDSPLEPNSPLCAQRYTCEYPFEWYLVVVLFGPMNLVLMY